ncbi:MAG: hypothetical protein AB1705_24680, partial [Verrucomicrobiota bacterium]
MAEEPKPIEQQLADYAQQRREAAGAPLEMHPATRNLLQGEVVRTYGKPEAAPAPEAPKPNLMALFWRRLAYAGSFAMLAMVVTLVLRNNPPGREDLELAQTKSAPLSRYDAPAMPAAAPLETPPPAPMAVTVESLDEAKPAVNGAERMESLRRGVATTPSGPANEKREAGARADKEMESLAARSRQVTTESVPADAMRRLQLADADRDSAGKSKLAEDRFAPGGEPAAAAERPASRLAIAPSAPPPPPPGKRLAGDAGGAGIAPAPATAPSQPESTRMYRTPALSGAKP